jgi:hypothetical protein
VKSQLLRVVYHRGENGQLYVFMYRGKLHLGTVEVNELNCLKVFRGVENTSPVLVKYLEKETA